jgi:hypothetical protein
MAAPAATPAPAAPSWATPAPAAPSPAPSWGHSSPSSHSGDDDK